MGADKEKEIAEYQKLMQINAKDRTDEENNRMMQLAMIYQAEINSMKALAADEEKYNVTPDPNPAKRNDFLDIIKDYNEKYGADLKPSEDPEKPCVLVFKDKEDAINFFREQAQKGRAFQVYNKETNHCIYSDGSGNIVHGTKEEVEQYKENPGGYKVNEDGTFQSTAPNPFDIENRFK